METMMATHEESMGRIKMQYQVPNLWYLEVIAVDPNWQGRGVGKKAMCSVLELVQDEPIVLECTSETNIGFYRKLGFEVVDEVQLAQGDEAVKLWFMLRQITNKDKCTPETVFDA
jgi:ribosomal protein S18 acetylase RimI-like enzyme